MIDLSDPTLDEQLQRRTTEGRFVISEIELVQNIRALHAQAHGTGERRLATVLLHRCGPAFQRYSQGLRHRPDLREEAIANMAEHILREALDENEVFITKNFVHYLHCACAEEFTRVLRQEGMSYRTDDQGRVAGRPQHVPSSLIEPLQPAAPDDEGMVLSDVADPHDQYVELHAEAECQRILTYLNDPTDRMIMVLRSIQGMKWDDIAVVCKRTERTVRLRYERARAYLRECINQEQQRVSYNATALQ